MDKSYATARYTAGTFLANQGVPVREDYRRAIMHNKFIVVDGQEVETGASITRRRPAKGTRRVYWYCVTRRWRSARRLQCLFMPANFSVFISHFTGEKRIAQKLQDFLLDAFPGLKVFRSSDTESIETAQGQYEAIISALRIADIVVVLLSSASANRPWMPFETGFAMGKGARVFTWLVRAAQPSDIPSPFAEMQLRAVDAGEAEKILGFIEGLTGSTRSPVSVNGLLRDIREAEASLPNVRLEVGTIHGQEPPWSHIPPSIRGARGHHYDQNQRGNSFRDKKSNLAASRSKRPYGVRTEERRGSRLCFPALSGERGSTEFDAWRIRFQDPPQELVPIDRSG